VLSLLLIIKQLYTLLTFYPCIQKNKKEKINKIKGRAKIIIVILTLPILFRREGQPSPLLLLHSSEQKYQAPCSNYHFLLGYN
jgi:hypothetical protein